MVDRARRFADLTGQAGMIDRRARLGTGLADAAACVDAIFTDNARKAIRRR